MKKLLIIILTLFALLGVIFFCMIAEEIYHAKTMKGSKAICLPTGVKINDNLQNGFLFAYTEFDLNKYEGVEEFTSSREASEKAFALIKPFLLTLIGFMIGMITLSLWESKKDE